MLKQKYNNSLYGRLERIAYGKMQCKPIFEILYVIKTFLARLVGSVERYTKVKAKHNEFHIIAETGSCTHS